MEKVANKPLPGVKPVKRPSSNIHPPVISSRKVSSTRKILGADSAKRPSSNLQKPVISNSKASPTRKVLGTDSAKRPSSNLQKPVISNSKTSPTRKILGTDKFHPKSITATVTKVNQTAKNVAKVFKPPLPARYGSQTVPKSKRNSISSTTSNTPKKPIRQTFKSAPTVKKKESGASNITAKPPIRPKVMKSKNEIPEKPVPIKKESNVSQGKIPKVAPKIAPKKQTSVVKPKVNEPNPPVKRKSETIAPTQPKVVTPAKPVTAVEKQDKVTNELDNKLKIDFSKIQEIEPDAKLTENTSAKFDAKISVRSSDLLIKKKNPNVDVALDSINIPATRSAEKKEIIDIKLPPPSNIPVLEKRAETKPAVLKKVSEPVKPAAKKPSTIKKTSVVKKTSSLEKKPNVEVKKVRKITTKKPGLKTINESMTDSERLKAAVSKLAKQQNGKTAAEIRERRRSNILKLIEKKKLELRAQKKDKAHEERLIKASPTQPIH